MHAPDCTLCSRLTRAEAYRYIGEPHIIPISHGTAWLSADLHRALEHIAVGDVVTVDYAGEVPDAPNVTFSMESEDVIAVTVDLADGAVITFSHPPIDGAPYPPIITATLQALVHARKARGVVIITRDNI